MSQNDAGSNRSNSSAPGQVDPCQAVCAALTGLQYGQVVVLIEHGSVVRIERIDRQRCFTRRKSNRQTPVENNR